MTDLALGLHAAIAAARYHADDLRPEPTLSSSLAKTLLAKTPLHAKLAHPRLNPAFESAEDAKYDLGSVAHELILGRGGGFAVLDFPAWTTKASKEARDDARAAGLTPILAHQHADAEAMAAASRAIVRATPGCEHAFEPGHGEAEVVGLWQDVGGPTCRMMIDWLGPTQADVWDVKTTGAGLSDAALSRQIDNLGYDLSAAFYLRGLTHLLPALAGRFRFRWLFIEDAAPFEGRVVEADAEQIGRGHRKAALAIAKWQRCLTRDLWPGYPREIARVGAPGWAEAQWSERELADSDFDRAVLLDHTPIPPPQTDTIIFGERLISIPSRAA